MKKNEMELTLKGVIPQRQPWATPQIDAAMIALSTLGGVAGPAEGAGTSNIYKNGS